MLQKLIGGLGKICPNITEILQHPLSPGDK